MSEETRKGANIQQFFEAVAHAVENDGDCKTVSDYLLEKFEVTTKPDSVYQRIAQQNAAWKKENSPNRLPKLKKDKNSTRGASPEAIDAVFSQFFGQPESVEQSPNGAQSMAEETEE